jgi:hypothetical protein
MDWSVVAILAAITWFDGLRRVPADAVVLRQVLGGSWTASEYAEPGRGWRLVAWWTPFTLALVVPSSGMPAASAAAQSLNEGLATRLHRARPVVLGLRLLGASVLASLVVGIPAAVARFGAWGFAASVGAVVLLATTTALAAFVGLRKLGHARRQATRIAAPLLSPFAAPRAAEVLLEHAVAGTPMLVLARTLLGVDSFASWIRPQAHDALRSDGTANARADALIALIGRPGLAAIVGRPPARLGVSECYCERCARVYRLGTTTCADCDGVPLVRAPRATRFDLPSVRPHLLGGALASIRQRN